MSRSNLLRVLLIAGAAVASAAAAAEPVSPSGRAAIPFANHGGIYDWKADRDRGLWVQDLEHQWYYARTMGPCTGLQFAQTIGFDTSPTGTLDRYGAIVVRDGPQARQRCTFSSFEQSAPPPKSGKPKQVQPTKDVPAATP
jgi:hypothetical protein